LASFGNCWFLCTQTTRFFCTKILLVLHWLGDSRFSAQFMVKNVVCFSDIFHWKKWWKIQIFFTFSKLPFEFFTSNSQNSENVLSFSLPFSVEYVWKTNNIFHHKLCWKTWISQPVLAGILKKKLSWEAPFLYHWITDRREESWIFVRLTTGRNTAVVDHSWSPSFVTEAWGYDCVSHWIIVCMAEVWVRLTIGMVYTDPSSMEAHPLLIFPFALNWIMNWVHYNMTLLHWHKRIELKFATNL
jgi:hypothetical protein